MQIIHSYLRCTDIAAWVYFYCCLLHYYQSFMRHKDGKIELQKNVYGRIYVRDMIFLASPLPPYVFFLANATNRNKGWNSCHWTHKLVMSRAFSNTSQATFNCWNISFSLITFKNILDFPVNNEIFLLKSFSDSLNYITICFKIRPAT